MLYVTFQFSGKQARVQSELTFLHNSRDISRHVSTKEQEKVHADCKIWCQCPIVKKMKRVTTKHQIKSWVKNGQKLVCQHNS